MLGSLGALYSSGISGGLEPHLSGRRSLRSTPVAYPWQRERCWLESTRQTNTDSSTGSTVARRRGYARSILFWAGISNRPHPAETHFWEVTLDKRALPYLDDHRIEGVAVLPASAYVEMALAAAVEAFGAQSFASEGYRISPGAFPARRRNPHAAGGPFSRRGRSSSLFRSTVAAGNRRNQVNHGRCMRPAGFVLKETAVSLRQDRKRSRRSRLDVRKRSPDRTITRDSAKAVFTTALFSGALLSCGGTTEMCSVKYRFPKGLKLNLAPIRFIRRSWTLACKFRRRCCGSGSGQRRTEHLHADADRRDPDPRSSRAASMGLRPSARAKRRCGQGRGTAPG